MTKITIVKNYRGKETLRVTELEEVVRFIQTSAYAEGQFLSRPEYKFESARKTSGWFYWWRSDEEGVYWQRSTITRFLGHFLLKSLAVYANSRTFAASKVKSAMLWDDKNRLAEASE